MKKLLSIVVLAITFFVVAVQPPALAADLAHGKQIFQGNCNACHLGGRNTIMAPKTLKTAALTKYLKGFDKDPVAAVTYQVTNGKGAMPRFAGRLKPNDIADVAAYVVDQAGKWK
ncbi:MAG: c-type cytochrome [Okeania sp. SIO2G4]|uniref:c-type cytochrome n=1 Tax=unclassified Okeania TaxID=2634635 RepID=UPI0013BA6807|nr:MULTISPECIES: c-type cytochrome [unclassified Okeania]NEP04833.1 c-type cytochrome [Okeania sp. SIO4D6]NEP39999.1 c-type cytochrome [Okeania sp. SIO2H7]NEP71059.1 c-type cytochrome [Okeania sp. SIO2G5]NEP91521.1 c-type cytochrome [Okeania sp. SIO2F5]NEQ89397.1 c-type cytochrome [Okeania sp. SIO2G4]